jgi:hypothetical protein
VVAALMDIVLPDTTIGEAPEYIVPEPEVPEPEAALIVLIFATVSSNVIFVPATSCL